jgi:NAD(P)-dependent dehydrogenase (short-subunit alcohol dehydrogenase family)
MDSFAGKLGVVTGGGSGIGRELVRQLAAQGCSVAACDLNPDTVAETVALARAGAPLGARVTSHACDVSAEAQVLRFRDELLEGHASDHVDLVFSNAGIGGGSSFISDPREVRPVGVAGPGHAQHAYATAKFAVRGFTEALIEDLRVHAPHVRAAVVMPGHVGTDIVANSLRILGLPDPELMSDAELEHVRPELTRRGAAAADASAGELRQMLARLNTDFRDNAPLSAAEAATVILDGVRSGAWRILVGEDAKTLDAQVRAKPEAAYDYAELFSAPAEEPAEGTPDR